MGPVDVTIYMNESAPICQEADRLLRWKLEERGVKSGSGRADHADVILRVSPFCVCPRAKSAFERKQIR
jgi:hypothetical protein